MPNFLSIDLFYQLQTQQLFPNITIIMKFIFNSGMHLGSNKILIIKAVGIIHSILWVSSERNDIVRAEVIKKFFGWKFKILLEASNRDFLLS